MKTVILIGISNKIGCKRLSGNNNTGKFVKELENAMPNIYFDKHNLIDAVLLDDKGKYRQPTRQEIKDAIPQIKRMIRYIDPDLVICFGKITYSAVLKARKRLVFYAPHPSWVMVYRRKLKDCYLQEIIKTISEHL